MPRYNQPVPLNKQALDVVARFVLDIGLHLAKTVMSSTSRDLETVDQMCTYLRNFYHSKVCRALANDFSATLLKCVHSLYCQNWQWMTEPKCEKVLQGLVDAAVHPDITKLDLDPIVEYLVPKIYKKMFMMTNLIDLKLTYLNYGDEELIVNGLKHLINLRNFHFNSYCTDRIVEALADSCAHLKCLDVGGSRKVTDASVPHIVKFRYLEEINVSNISLTKDGLSRLINGLSVEDTHLKCFQGSCISDENLQLLVANFPHLTQLGLRTFSQNNMSLLNNFNELKTLRLEDGCFFLIRDLLGIIGENLSFLELMDVKNVDVNFVCNTCPNIENLTVASYEVNCNSPDYIVSDLSLCGFQSLKTLTVYEPEDPPFMGYLLSKCINLKEVHLTVGPGFDDSMMKSVLKRNPLNHLEIMSLYSKGSSLTVATVRNLLEHCPKLNVLRGLQSWKCKNLDHFMEEIKVTYPGVQLLKK